MPISSPGIGSGLDVNSIVQTLLTIERQPIRQLQSEAGKLQTQISAFGKLQSALSTLRDTSAKLAQASQWSATAATSSDPSAVAATATGAPQAGNYSIFVNRLASAQTLVSGNRFESATSTLGSGTLRIELGDFDSTPPVPKTGATAVQIEIEPGASSLSAVKDRINAAGAGVVASIVSDVSGSRLVVRSAETGQENGFRIEVLADNGGTGPGLSSLAFDASNGGGVMVRPQSAANAQATINGISVESGSNTLNDAVQGLSVTLRKLGGEAEVKVEPDTDALKKAVDEFAKAYDESVRLLREQTRFDPATNTAGPLQGDRSSAAMLAQLRGLFSAPSGASSVFSNLADIGLSLNTEGKIKTDGTKLKAALTNGGELSKLFANVDAATPANNGVGTRFQSWLKLSLDTDGTLDSRTQSLQARVKNNQQAQDRLEDRVTRSEQRLRQQYNALDTRMGQLTGLASYVSQQMSLLNNNGR